MKQYIFIHLFLFIMISYGYGSILLLVNTGIKRVFEFKYNYLQYWTEVFLFILLLDLKVIN